MTYNKLNTIAYINGSPYDILPGETILSFIKRHKSKDAIPTLCDAPNLDPFGSCRVCSVEVGLSADGPFRAQASCHTPVMPGSFILTDSDKIKKLRKNI